MADITPLITRAETAVNEFRTEIAKFSALLEDTEQPKRYRETQLGLRERHLSSLLEKWANEFGELQAGVKANAAAAEEKLVAAAEERLVAADKKFTAAEEKATAAEEKATAAEEKATAADEKATAADEKATAADEKLIAADEKLTKATETENKWESRMTKLEEREGAIDDRERRSVKREDDLSSLELKATMTRRAQDERGQQLEQRERDLAEREKAVAVREAKVEEKEKKVEEDFKMTESRSTKAEQHEKDLEGWETLLLSDREKLAKDREALDLRATGYRSRYSKLHENFAGSWDILNTMEDGLKADLAQARQAVADAAQDRNEISQVREDLERASSLVRTEKENAKQLAADARLGIAKRDEILATLDQCNKTLATCKSIGRRVDALLPTLAKAHEGSIDVQSLIRHSSRAERTVSDVGEEAGAVIEKLATSVDTVKARTDVIAHTLSNVTLNIARLRVDEGRGDKRPTSSHSNEPTHKRARSVGPSTALSSAPLRATDTNFAALHRRQRGHTEATDVRPVPATTGQAGGDNQGVAVDPLRGLSPGSGNDPAQLTGAHEDIKNVWRQIEFGAEWTMQDSEDLLMKFVNFQDKPAESRRPQPSLDRNAEKNAERPQCLIRDMGKSKTHWRAEGSQFRCIEDQKQNRHCVAVSWFGDVEPGPYESTANGKRWTVKARQP